MGITARKISARSAVPPEEKIDCQSLRDPTVTKKEEATDKKTRADQSSRKERAERSEGAPDAAQVEESREPVTVSKGENSEGRRAVRGDVIKCSASIHSLWIRSPRNQCFNAMLSILFELRIRHIRHADGAFAFTAMSIAAVFRLRRRAEQQSTVGRSGSSFAVAASSLCAATDSLIAAA